MGHGQPGRQGADRSDADHRPVGAGDGRGGAETSVDLQPGPGGQVRPPARDGRLPQEVQREEEAEGRHPLDHPYDQRHEAHQGQAPEEAPAQ